MTEMYSTDRVFFIVMYSYFHIDLESLTCLTSTHSFARTKSPRVSSRCLSTYFTSYCGCADFVSSFFPVLVPCKDVVSACDASACVSTNLLCLFSKHILNAQVSIRAPCCKLWFDCAECHAETQDHRIAKTTEMAFACKKCKKVFRKDMTEYDESDEYCPHCDNHFVSTRLVLWPYQIDFASTGHTCQDTTGSTCH